MINKRRYDNQLVLGIHSFYKGEDKTIDEITMVIEANEVQQDTGPFK